MSDCTSLSKFDASAEEEATRTARQKVNRTSNRCGFPFRLPLIQSSFVGDPVGVACQKLNEMHFQYISLPKILSGNGKKNKPSLKRGLKNLTKRGTIQAERRSPKQFTGRREKFWPAFPVTVYCVRNSVAGSVSPPCSPGGPRMRRYSLPSRVAAVLPSPIILHPEARRSRRTIPVVGRTVRGTSRVPQGGAR